MRRQYTAEQRREFIDLVTAGRATISEAAARLGVPPSTAYYWARKAAAQPVRPARPRGRSYPPSLRRPPRRRSCNSSARATTGAVIEVRIGRTAIQVRPGFDAELLRAVIELLREIVG